MRDVIGQDELEEAAPSPRARSAARRRRTAACALAAGAAVAFASGLAGRTDTAPAERPDTGPGAGSVPVGGERAGRGAREVVPGSVRVADPALRAQLAARPLGGSTVRTDAGASGDVRLEVRNGGPALRLVALTAEVPGVRFSQVVPPNGVQLGPEERVELVLGFDVDDCAQLRRTGRLVLHVDQAGVREEVGLTVTHDREAGTVRQVALDRVLGACPV